MSRANKLKRGQTVFAVLIFASVAVILLGGLVNWSVVSVRASRESLYRERAFQIAEAGIDYYRWHLAHAPTDYQDGTGTAGPYVHDFLDKDGAVVGQFSLEITPPITGSTLVKIKSTGQTAEYPSVKRAIQVSLAIPSFAKYAVVANQFMRFGSGTEVYGPIHSNGGVHFDGLAHNVVSSLLSTTTDEDDSSKEFGVFTDIAPADPDPTTYGMPPWPAGTVPSHSDVFQVGRQFPMAKVDFAGMTVDLATASSSAKVDGKFYGPSGALGYKIVLKTTDKFDIYKVTATTPLPAGGPPGTPNRNCTNSANQDSWGSWSVSATTPVATNVSFPNNGLIFAEDNLWVEGTIDTARLTIIAAVLPDNVNTRKTITINNNLTYTNHDGQDVIGLIAQKNINVGLNSLDTLNIDAALVAQNGRVGRHYYSSNCSNYKPSTLNLYGMIATNQRYGFAYGDPVTSGYQTRNLIYDVNLLYGPPPSFPLTSQQYTILSWEEVN